MSAMTRHSMLLEFTASPAIVDIREWSGFAYKSTGGSVSQVAIDVDADGAFARTISAFAEGSNGHCQTPDADQQRALYHAGAMKVTFTGTLKVFLKG
jgi:hypothetical protein